MPRDLVDFDLCWAFDFSDPWGNQYELNCYDDERVREGIVKPLGFTPVRYWPRETHEGYMAR